MKSQYVVCFTLASGRGGILGAQTFAELLELIRDLPRDAEVSSRWIGRRVL